MRKGRVEGHIWPPTTSRCHERCNGARCEREQGHTEHVPSKNPDLERLNGWHQSRAGCWKGGVFMTWKAFEALRRESMRA